MAVKYFCDGCDCALSSDRKKITVTVHDTQPAPLLGCQYDLCRGCEQKLVQNANPTKWHRLANAHQ